MQISKRLQAVAGMITPGLILADVGTDHGYIPIYLLQKGKIPYAIAMDINKGPLQRAMQHIREANLEQFIETRLSDGLKKLQPGEVHSSVIAGMGGMLTIKILSEGEQVAKQLRELILQPQSDLRAVREFLGENGYALTHEEMVKEDGKYYPMMRVIPEKYWENEPDYINYSECTEGQLQFGPLLLKERHPVLLEYLKKEYGQCQRILANLQRQNTDGSQQRMAQILEKQALIGAYIL